MPLSLTAAMPATSANCAKRSRWRTSFAFSAVELANRDLRPAEVLHRLEPMMSCHERYNAANNIADSDRVLQTNRGD